MRIQFPILLLLCVIITFAEYVSQYDSLKKLIDQYEIESSKKGLIDWVPSTVPCIICAKAVELLLNERNSGSNEMYMLTMMKNSCSLILYFLNHEVCIKLIMIHYKIVLYIINNAEVSPSSICGTLMQQCSERFRPWSVNIAEGQTVQKLKGNPELTPINVLHLTDVHYDPLYQSGSNANCNKPVCCQADSSMLLFPSEGAGYWSDYRHCDTSMHMMTNTFDYIKDNLEYDYVYFTGDIVAHRIWDTSVLSNSNAIDEFYDLLVEKLSDKPIYPVLGNHEPHPLDMFAPEDLADTEFSTEWLFKKIWHHWKKLLPKETKETILKGGFYTVLVKPGFRIIALNNNVAYTLNFWIMYNRGDTYGQLDWFQKTLAEAELANEQVHVLMHLPNGETWTYSPWAKNFALIVERYSNTIKGLFYGHTHFAEMNVLYTKDNLPMAVGYNGGSITPFEDVNPNFRIYKVDAINMDILDFDEYICNLTRANSNPSYMPWKKLYSFKSEYGMKSLSPGTMHGLVEDMSLNTELRMRYFRNHVTYGEPSLVKGCDITCQKELLCKWVTTVYNEFYVCNMLKSYME